MCIRDRFKESIEEEIGLSDNKIKLLSTLLLQNAGKLSMKKQKSLFDLTDEEVSRIEEIFGEVHGS